MGKVFAYTRVSTMKQGEKGVSLQEQRDAILRYAQQHGLEVIRWFEEKETASKQGRPAFNQMLRLLRLGNASGVVIHKIDRSARNLHDWADIGRFVDAGIEMHFASESLDLKTVGGRLSADIQAVVAAHYSRNLREETRKGFYGRLKQGFYPLSAPVGYLDQGSAKTKTKDPVMGSLVTQAFELYRTGRYSLPLLAKEMYGRGLRNRRGGRVSLNGISKVLTNRFYTGVMVIKKTGEVFTGRHDALVSNRLFDEVQAMLHGKAVDRVLQHRFTFSRIVSCRTCDYSLIGELKKGHVYYRCHNRPFKNPPACPPTSIREEALEGAILACLSRITISETDVEFARAWISEQAKSAVDERAQALEAQRVQLDAVRARLGRLTDLLLEKSIETAVFDDKRRELILQEAEVKQQIAALEPGFVTEQPGLEKFVELVKTPVLLYETADQEKKRELLRILLSNLTVSGKNIEITLKTPFQLLAEDAESADSTRHRASCRNMVKLLTKIQKYFRANPAALGEPSSKADLSF